MNDVAAWGQDSLTTYVSRCCALEVRLEVVQTEVVKESWLGVAVLKTLRVI